MSVSGEQKPNRQYSSIIGDNARNDISPDKGVISD